MTKKQNKKEISSLKQIRKIHKRGKFSFDILSIKQIEKGIEVFASVYDKKGKQIGFGKDGSIDIERFRFINPPVLVPDENGEIKIKGHVDKLTGKKEDDRCFRKDPKEALFQMLEQTLDVKKQIFDDKNIIKGKIGMTTSTFYPDASPESTSFDGRMYVQINATAQADWDTVHDATTAFDEDDDAVALTVQTSNNSGHSSTKIRFWRSIVLFDTSAIDSGDTIDSAVLSLYPTAVDDAVNDGNDFISVVLSNPASNTGISSADFDELGTTEQHDSGERKDLTSIGTGAYVSWTFNATGEGNITKGGITKLGLLEGHDLLDDYYGPATNKRSFVNFSSADETGTTQDPKLVVEHTTPVSSPTVTTQAVDDIEKTTITANGNITATGGVNATRRGFAYFQASSGDPDTSDSVEYEDGDFGTGAFDEAISGLTKGLPYRVRAYAVNTEGTSYGTTVDVVTKDDDKITKGLIYDVITETKIEKGLIYDVVSGVAIQKSLKYTILTLPSAIEKTLEYQIKTDTPIEKGLIYKIKSAVGIAKGLIYSVITETNIQKSLHYEVLSNTAIQKALQYVIIKWFQPSNLDLTVGSIISGKLSDVYLADGNELILGEDLGVNPAFVYDFDFYGIPDVGGTHYDAHFHAKYNGSPSHRVKLQQYNFNTLGWENVTTNLSDFPYNAAIQTYTYHLIEGADYYDSGHIRLRLNHSSGTGVDTHTMVIDQFILESHGEVTRTLKYTIKSPVKIEKSLKYTIEQTPTAITKGLDYYIGITTNIQKSLHYEILSNTAITKSLRYAVKTCPAAKTKSLQYEVLTSDSITKSLNYEVITSEVIQKSLQYALNIVPVTIQKSLRYEIVTEDLIQKTLHYEIKSPVSITKSLEYQVTSDVAITKSIIYEVMRSHVITKGLEYRIVNEQTPITKSLAYEVIVENPIEKTLQYEVRKFPYAYGDILGYKPFY